MFTKKRDSVIDNFNKCEAQELKNDNQMWIISADSRVAARQLLYFDPRKHTHVIILNIFNIS